MASVIHAMGPTCAGKSTIINALVARAPHLVYPLQIGKILRAKYGEAYFQGQAAPEKTREEAITLYRECVAAAIEEGYEIIIIDGQPRDLEQSEEMISLWRAHRSEFWLIHADHAIREERARLGRTPGPDLELAVARLTNDYRNNYTVMTNLIAHGVPISVVDTGKDTFDVESFVTEVLTEYTDSY